MSRAAAERAALAFLRPRGSVRETILADLDQKQHNPPIVDGLVWVVSIDFPGGNRAPSSGPLRRGLSPQDHPCLYHDFELVIVDAQTGAVLFSFGAGGPRPCPTR